MKSNTFSQTQGKQINHGQTLPQHHNPRNFSVILKEKRLQNFHIRLKNLMNIPCHSLKFKTGSKLKIIWYFSGLKANNIHNKVRNRHVDVWVIVSVGVDVCVLHTKRVFVNIISWWGFRCMVYKVIRISVGLSVCLRCYGMLLFFRWYGKINTLRKSTHFTLIPPPLASEQIVLTDRQTYIHSPQPLSVKDYIIGRRALQISLKAGNDSCSW